MTKKEILRKKREKLEHFIFPRLKCVQCGLGDLRLRKTEIQCLGCGEEFPLFQETPIMMAQPDQAFQYTSSVMVTNVYDQHWYDIMEKAKGGPILDLGSGNNPVVIDHLVKFDMFALPNVEVVGDAEKLPFKPDSFHLIISGAVFEHLRNPFVAATNLFEILVGNGTIYIETAFLQPLHAYPNHFFNMTKPGIEEMFSEFEKLASGTQPHQYPSFTLRWVISEWLKNLPKEKAEEFLNTTIGEIQDEYTRTPFSTRWMETFTITDREGLAAGVFFHGRKLPSGSNSSSILVSQKTLGEVNKPLPEAKGLARALPLLFKKGWFLNFIYGGRTKYMNWVKQVVDHSRLLTKIKKSLPEPLRAYFRKYLLPFPFYRS